MSERVEWGVMQHGAVPHLVGSWPTREEAEANCYAREVSRLRRERELVAEFGDASKAKVFSLLDSNDPYYVASRRVTDWEEAERREGWVFPHQRPGGLR